MAGSALTIRATGAPEEHSTPLTLHGDGGLLGWLQGRLNGWGCPVLERLDQDGCGAELPFDFQCGYVGFLGYELRHESGHAGRTAEAVPEEAAVGVGGMPTAGLRFADRFIAFDHDERRVYVLSLCEAEGEQSDRESALEWIAQTMAAIGVLGEGEVAADKPAAAAGKSQPEADGEEDGWMRVRVARGKTQYLADIERALELIAAGESYEVCLTSGASVPGLSPPLLPLYTELRRSNPAPYGALLRFGDLRGAGEMGGGGGFSVLSSSPERFLKISADGGIESKPIKGTARRGSTEAEDQALQEALQCSEKERAENLMIVDLTRHDLGQVCEVGSVHVPEGALFAVESYATVHQLVSTVRGQLRGASAAAMTEAKDGAESGEAGPVGAAQAAAACFPPGSMTGAPKHRTMQIIDELEQSAPRGVYSGAIGYFSLSGAADLAVVIRTLVCAEDGVHIGGGGAIVHQSSAEEEWAEVLLKLRAPLSALARTVGKSGVCFGGGERLRIPSGGAPQRCAFTTIPWDYSRSLPAEGEEGAEELGRPGALRLWRVDEYFQRLADNCARLGIEPPAQPAKDRAGRFRAQLCAALKAWAPPALAPETEGQGLFRVEWTAAGEMALSCRVLPPLAEAKRCQLAAVSLPAPWWAMDGVTGCKHGSWAPYMDAMHAARAQGAYCALLVDPDGAVVDGDRVTPVLRDATGRVRYPPPHAGAVQSVTMRLLLESLAEEGDQGLRLEEESFTLDEVLAGQELVVVGSGVGVGRLVEVDGTALAKAAEEQAGEGLYEALRRCLDRARCDLNLNTLSFAMGCCC